MLTHVDPWLLVLLKESTAVPTAAALAFPTLWSVASRLAPHHVQRSETQRQPTNASGFM